MNKREREICGRVHFVRTEIVKWSQPDLARELNITQNQLAGLEYALSPLRYGVGRILCDKCHVSQRWLATGNLPIRVFVEIHSARERQIPSDALFSCAYDEFLDELVTPELEAIARGNHCKVADLDKHRRQIGMRWTVGTPQGDAARIYHERILNWRVPQLPPAVQIKVFRQLNAVLDQLPPFGQTALTDGDEIRTEPKASFLCKGSLDKENPIVYDAGVKAKIRSLPDLVKRLRDLTKLRGKKAALARDLQVSRQAVDQWLSEKTAPTAETALKLLAWVEEQ